MYLGSAEQFWVDARGLISTGNRGRASQANDPQHGYALGDVFTHVPLTLLEQPGTPIQVERVGPAQYRRRIPTGDQYLLLTFPSLPYRTFLRTVGQPVNPHGFKLRSLALTYQVVGSPLTSISLKVYRRALTPQDPVPASVELPSTQSGGGLAVGTDQRQVVATVTTPVFISDLDNVVLGELNVVVPGGASFFDLYGATARISLAIY